MKFRRHVPRALNWTAWTDSLVGWIERLGRVTRRRQLLVWLGALTAAFVVGYVFAALILFPAPIFAATKVVPRVLGIAQEAARQQLEQAGLEPGEIDAVTHPSVPRSHVVWQDPPPGTAMPEGSAVRLSISSGPQLVPVPDLAGYDAELAQRLIIAAGLRVGRIDATQAPIPKDVLVNTRPPAGAALMPGTQITLVVSVGTPTITVPDLTGLAREEASDTLELVGLTLGTSIWRTSAAGPPGTIIGQDPAPRTLSAPGTPVNVTLARRRQE